MCRAHYCIKNVSCSQPECMAPGEGADLEYSEVLNLGNDRVAG